ncbi:MAG: SURF1 family protein [Hyphomicrobiales bacterium]
MAGRSRIWPVVVATLAGVVVLVGLGVWQLQRLSWKEALLAQLAANQAAAPVTLSEADARRSAGDNVEFLKIRVEGEWLHDSEMRMMSVFDGGPGWEIVTPLRAPDGRIVLVDRGVVPDSPQSQIIRPAGPVSLVGFVRSYGGARGYFAPDNDPAGKTWYWWDVPAMLSTIPPLPGARPVDFVLQLEPGTDSASLPRPNPPQAKLRNNHLSYAVTWFSLAATLLVIAALYLRGQMKKTTA